MYDNTICIVLWKHFFIVKQYKLMNIVIQDLLLDVRYWSFLFLDVELAQLYIK
jgi:hypothetical protein